MRELPRLEFVGEWRRYQRLALEAFERDVLAGRRHTHVVAPPGSGKTLLGAEIVNRIGRRALVLAPNSAIQTQWLRALSSFAPDGGSLASASPDAQIACLTYQSLCQIDDPAVALGDVAERRWARDRAAATGEPLEAVLVDGRSWTGAAARRRGRELARIAVALKREIARGHHEVDLADLFSSGVRRRLEALRGVGTLVLDECHHLASMWGYVVRAAVDELGDVHLVGLTATPPDDLSEEEAELYAELLGPIDFTVPTPAVVRDGYLAPFQELAWLTEPLEGELQWLSEHDVRFQELVTELHGEEPGVSLSLAGWVITRMRYREGEDGGEVSWARFQKRHPALARAGIRFLSSGRLPLPEHAPRGEGYREPPDLEDWLVLLEDYALRCLAADPSVAAAARYDAVGAALRDLGFQLTRQGIRRAASDVDRLLTASAAKPLALVEVLACEYDARGDRLRGLVLCDAESAAARPRDDLVGVLDPGAGTAPRAVSAIAADFRTAPLRPLLVSGRGLRCDPVDADALLAAIRTAAPADSALAEWRAQDGGDGLARLVAAGADWTARTWVRLATAAFATGASRLLVGTRAMLGEGWDAPCVNCLVDITSSTTSVSVRQMRGRSLRLDPADPDKIASNWDVVCVAPRLARGVADYRRFVRKHLHLFAPCEDGEIEAGPSHVHPDLDPLAPPRTEVFGEINRAMRERATAHREARERWAIGQPYSGGEYLTVTAHAARDAPTPAPVLTEQPPAYPVDQRGPAAGIVGGLVAAGLGVALTAPLAVPGLVGTALAAGWAWARDARMRERLSLAAPLDLAARALCDAYVELGELGSGAAASLEIEPRASGYLRCLLRRATPEESRRFSTALNELLAPVEAPRYLVSRLVPAGAPRWRWFGRGRFSVSWHAVPRDLGRVKARAETFARAWERWLGPSRLVFTQRSDAGRRTLAAAAAQAETWSLSSREIWM
jgi:superfamily II DNA or RNA helicase